MSRDMNPTKKVNFKDFVAFLQTRGNTAFFLEPFSSCPGFKDGSLNFSEQDALKTHRVTLPTGMQSDDVTVSSSLERGSRYYDPGQMENPEDRGAPC